MATINLANMKLCFPFDRCLLGRSFERILKPNMQLINRGQKKICLKKISERQIEETHLRSRACVKKTRRCCVLGEIKQQDINTHNNPRNIKKM